MSSPRARWQRRSWRHGSDVRPGLARTIGTLAGLILSALMVGETALRLSRFGFTPSALGPWRKPIPWSAIRSLGRDGAPAPRPDGFGHWGLHAWSEPITYRLDAAGSRIGGLPARTPAAPRILVLGDSNAFGYGVEASSSFASQLERGLAGLDLAVRVENAGVCASDTLGQLHRLAERAHDLRPGDIVIHTVSPWSLRLDRPPSQPALPGLGRRIANVLEGRIGDLADQVGIADRLYRWIARFTRDSLDWPAGSTVAWEIAPLLASDAVFERHGAGALEALETALTAVRAGRATSIVLFVPLDIQVGTDRNRLYRDGLLPYPSWGFVDRDYTGEQRHVAMLTRTCSRLGVSMIDATEALRRIPATAFLPDDYHLSATGHAAITALLTERVAPLVTHARRARDDQRTLMARNLSPGFSPRRNRSRQEDSR